MPAPSAAKEETLLTWELSGNPGVAACPQPRPRRRSTTALRRSLTVMCQAWFNSSGHRVITTTFSERAGPCGIALLWGIESGRNLARHPLDSRPLSRSPPRLPLFPHRRATPSADVIEDFFVEQHQEKALSHWHGTFAGRAEEQARL